MLFNTTFLIDAVNGDSGAAKVAKEVDQNGVAPSLSAVSTHEYLTGVYFTYHGKRVLDEKIVEARNELRRFRILPFEMRIALVSAKINAELLRKGKVIGINDIYIAATALYYGAELVSRNTKHFSAIPSLRLRNY